MLLPCPALWSLVSGLIYVLPDCLTLFHASSIWQINCKSAFPFGCPFKSSAFNGFVIFSRYRQPEWTDGCQNKRLGNLLLGDYPCLPTTKINLTYPPHTLERAAQKFCFDTWFLCRLQDRAATPTATKPAPTAKITQTEKGSNYRDIFGFVFSTFLFLFFLQTLFWPARSLLFSFWCLHLFCLLGHVGQIPNHCLLLEVSESRVTTNSNTQHRQFHGFNWVQALAVYYATQRYVGHADCRATKSLTTEFGLLVNCRRQMLMSPYWRTLISSWPLRALRVAELADEANQMHLTNIYIDFPNTFSFCELVCKIKPI